MTSALDLTCIVLVLFGSASLEANSEWVAYFF